MSTQIEAIIYDNVPLKNGQQDILIHIRKLEARNAELLEALEHVLERADAQNGLDKSATHDGLQNCDAIAAARAAIRKVKGE